MLEDSLKTTAESMALAVLKGDLKAALALADYLIEESQNFPQLRRQARETPTYPLAADGHSVYQWPEFRAFCDRAGILWDLRTIDMVITIREGEYPTVVHRYALSDTFTPFPTSLPSDQV